MRVQTAVKELEAATAHCKSFVMNICLSYGGRGDIVEGCKKVCEKVKLGVLSSDDITETSFSEYLSTAGQPGMCAVDSTIFYYVAY